MKEGTGEENVSRQYHTPVGQITREQLKLKHAGETKRYIGLDLSKQSCYVCIINKQGEVEKHRSYSMRSNQRHKLYETLQTGDVVLMEASTGTFNIARAMNKHSGVVACVINPHTTRINETKKKTDKEDSLFLARLIARTPVVELSLVSIPSDQEMANRETISYYQHLKKQHTQGINRMHALFYEKGFPEAGKAYNLHTKGGRAAAIEKYIGSDRVLATTKRLLKGYSKQLTLLEQQMESEDTQFAKIVKQDDRMAAILGSIPGVGLKSISAFIAFVGDINRFSSAKQLASYCGLVPRVSQSGQKNSTGKITKEGQAALREYLVEAVLTIQNTKFDFPLKRKYLEMKQRMNGRKAAVAIARKLVTIMYAMLKNGTVFFVEKEEERKAIATYQSRKRIKSLGGYYKICNSCKEYSEMIEVTNTLHSNEIGVLKFI